MTATGDCMSNEGFWPIAVFGAFPVHEFFHDAAISDYDGGSGS